MAIQIIEKAIIGKQNQETCEDGIVVTDDFVAVIDGSTSKTPNRLNPNMKNGRYCMILISQCLQKIPANISCPEFCKEITDFIASQYFHNQLDIKKLILHPEERATASAIIYNNYRKEIWMIGDCQCLVDNQLYNNDKPYENRIAQKRVQLIKSGLTPQKAREVIEPDLIQAMLEGQNKHYSVIDGFPICENNIKIVSTVNSHQIVLASDGYPFLKNTLKESESLLEQQLKNDPQNIRTFIATKGLMPGNKSFDDRSYIRFFI